MSRIKILGISFICLCIIGAILSSIESNKESSLKEQQNAIEVLNWNKLTIEQKRNNPGKPLSDNDFITLDYYMTKIIKENALDPDSIKNITSYKPEIGIYNNITCYKVCYKYYGKNAFGATIPGFLYAYCKHDYSTFRLLGISKVN